MQSTAKSLVARAEVEAEVADVQGVAAAAARPMAANVGTRAGGN